MQLWYAWKVTRYWSKDFTSTKHLYKVSRNHGAMYRLYISVFNINIKYDYICFCLVQCNSRCLDIQKSKNFWNTDDFPDPICTSPDHFGNSTMRTFLPVQFVFGFKKLHCTSQIEHNTIDLIFLPFKKYGTVYVFFIIWSRRVKKAVFILLLFIL